MFHLFIILFCSFILFLDVFSLRFNNAENEAKKIIEINSQRYRIEDCFRVLKTNFKARPINHRKNDRIIAHFMTCYTALLIQRIMEVKLNQKGRHFTTGEIIENLKNMNVVNNHDLYYLSLIHI